MREEVERGYDILCDEGGVLNEILYSVSSVEEFRLKLLEVVMRREESLSYMCASLDARVLLGRMEGEACFESRESVKIVLYPNGSGVDLFIGEDVEEVSEKFGWCWRELRMV